MSESKEREGRLVSEERMDEAMDEGRAADVGTEEAEHWLDTVAGPPDEEETVCSLSWPSSVGR